MNAPLVCKDVYMFRSLYDSKLDVYMTQNSL